MSGLNNGFKGILGFMVVLGWVASLSACSPVVQPQQNQAVQGSPITSDISDQPSFIEIQSFKSEKMQRLYDFFKATALSSKNKVQGYVLQQELDRSFNESAADAYLRLFKSKFGSTYWFSQYYRNISPEFILQDNALGAFSFRESEELQVAQYLAQAARAGFIVLSGEEPRVQSTDSASILTTLRKVKIFMVIQPSTQELVLLNAD